MSYHTQREPVAAVIDECRKLGVEGECWLADLRSPEAAEHLVEQTVQRFGRLDVLVNLTSIYTRTPFSTLTPADFHAMVDSNLAAPYWTALAAARQMQRQPIEQGLQGKIIHFTDWAIDRPYRDFLPYLVAKGGLATLTRALAVELAPTILVNAIAPGTVAPPPQLSAVQRGVMAEQSALQRIGTMEDVNQAVLYLLEGTDFVTGEIYRVDGGRFLGPVEANTGDAD